MSERPQFTPVPSLGQAGVDPHSIPLDEIDVSDPEFFETDTSWGCFERLRNEAPVRFYKGSRFADLPVRSHLR